VLKDQVGITLQSTSSAYTIVLKFYLKVASGTAIKKQLANKIIFGANCRDSSIKALLAPPLADAVSI
jgi:hypothetical protein